MLTSVRIRGFRSCRDVTLDGLEDVTALIGRNAAGKSNLLKAIDAMARLASSGVERVSGLLDFFPSLEYLHEFGRPEFACHVTVGDTEYAYRVSAFEYVDEAESGTATSTHFSEKLEVREPSGWGVVFERDGETVRVPSTDVSLNIGSSVAAMAALSAISPADDPILAVTEPLRRFFAGVHYFSLDEPAESADAAVVRASDYRKWLGTYKAIGSLGASVPCQVLHLFLTDKLRFNEFASRIGPYGLKLVESVTVDTLRPHAAADAEPALYVVLFSKRQVVDRPLWAGFNELSQGTRRTLRLALALSFGHSPLMLVEHPEDGIHKGLVRKIAGLFTSGVNEGQVLLSTHSDTLMNALGPTNIRFVSIQDGETSVRKLSEDELAGAAEFIGTDGEGTLAEFLHSVED